MMIVPSAAVACAVGSWVPLNRTTKFGPRKPLPLIWIYWESVGAPKVGSKELICCPQSGQAQ